VTCPLIARAQQAGDRVKRIGWLSTAQHPYLAPFRQGLAAAGFVEGKDVEIVLTSGEAERMPLLAQSLAKDAIDVIVTSGAAAGQAARRDITTKPVVFVTSDPIALGLVETLAHPSSNPPDRLGRRAARVCD
jgi:putative ABC transport system substrate-binding protein